MLPSSGQRILGGLRLQRRLIGVAPLRPPAPEALPLQRGVGALAVAQAIGRVGGQCVLVVAAEDWGLLAKGGLNFSGNHTKTYDDYFATRKK